MKAGIKSPAKRWLLVVPGLVILVLLLSASTRLTLSDIYHHHVEQFLTHWSKESQDKKEKFTVQETGYQRVLKNSALSLSLQPHDSDAYLQVAQVLLWQNQLSPENFTTETRQEMLSHYRKALALRPAWPYGWIAFAQAKSQLGEIDEEFNQALIQSARLGAWERPVQKELAILGFHYEGWLAQEALPVLEENLARFSKQYPREALTVAMAYGKEAEVCELLTKKNKYKVCRS